MVIRQWIFTTAAENAERFEAFEYKYGLPMVQGQLGCLRVEFFCRRPEENSNDSLVEYTMISAWESWKKLQTALQSQSWREEVALFLTQGFGEGNGTVSHFDQI
jgi:hypothetical protein